MKYIHDVRSNKLDQLILSGVLKHTHSVVGEGSIVKYDVFIRDGLSALQPDVLAQCEQHVRNQPTLDTMWANFSKYGEPVDLRLDANAFDFATRMISSRWKPKGKRAIEMNREIQSMNGDIDQLRAFWSTKEPDTGTTNPGYPYCHKFKTKKQAMKHATQDAGALLESYVNGTPVRDVNEDVWMVFGKPNTTAIHEPCKVRTILCPPMDRAVLAGYLWHPLMCYHTSDGHFPCESDIGMSWYHGKIDKLMSRFNVDMDKLKDDKCYYSSGDISGFDRSCTDEITGHLLSIMIEWLPYSHGWKKFMKDDAFDMLHTKCVLPDGTLVRKCHGIASGHVMTSLIGTMTHAFVYYYSVYRKCSHIGRPPSYAKEVVAKGHYRLYGDDNLCICNDTYDYEVLRGTSLAPYYKECGFNLKYTNESPRLRDHSYLGFYIHKLQNGQFVGIRSMKDTFVNLLYPNERKSTPRDWLKNKSRMRLIAHYMISFFHQTTRKLLEAIYHRMFGHATDKFYLSKFARYMLTENGYFFPNLPSHSDVMKLWDRRTKILGTQISQQSFFPASRKIDEVEVIRPDYSLVSVANDNVPYIRNMRIPDAVYKKITRIFTVSRLKTVYQPLPYPIMVNELFKHLGIRAVHKCFIDSDVTNTVADYLHRRFGMVWALQNDYFIKKRGLEDLPHKRVYEKAPSKLTPNYDRDVSFFFHPTAVKSKYISSVQACIENSMVHSRYVIMAISKPDVCDMNALHTVLRGTRIVLFKPHCISPTHSYMFVVACGRLHDDYIPKPMKPSHYASHLYDMRRKLDAQIDAVVNKYETIPRLMESRQLMSRESNMTHKTDYSLKFKSVLNPNKLQSPGIVLSKNDTYARTTSFYNYNTQANGKICVKQPYIIPDDIEEKFSKPYWDD